MKEHILQFVLFAVLFHFSLFLFLLQKAKEQVQLQKRIADLKATIIEKREQLERLRRKVRRVQERPTSLAIVNDTFKYIPDVTPLLYKQEHTIIQPSSTQIVPCSPVSVSTPPNVSDKHDSQYVSQRSPQISPQTQPSLVQNQNSPPTQEVNPTLANAHASSSPPSLTQDVVLSESQTELANKYTRTYSACCTNPSPPKPYLSAHDRFMKLHNRRLEQRS